MLLEAGGFDALAARFGALGRADQEAVLSNLNAADRARVTAAFARQDALRRGEAVAVAVAQRTGRQYAAYSPWLAEIVRQGDASQVSRQGIAQPVREAIAAAHSAMVKRGDVAAASLWSQAWQGGVRLLSRAGLGRL